eukprot:3583344-Amphidinium_carterae.1
MSFKKYSTQAACCMHMLVYGTVCRTYPVPSSTQGTGGHIETHLALDVCLQLAVKQLAMCSENVLAS